MLDSSVSDAGELNVGGAIARDAEVSSANLTACRLRLFPRAAEKSVQAFSSATCTRLIGVRNADLRNLELAGETLGPSKAARGHRAYSSGRPRQVGARDRPLQPIRDDDAQPSSRVPLPGRRDRARGSAVWLLQPELSPCRVDRGRPP